MPRSVKPERTVHVQKGQTLIVRAGGVEIHVARFDSGAVRVINRSTGAILRSWGPKEAKDG